MVKEQGMWNLRDKNSVAPDKVDFESLINKVSVKPKQTEQEMSLVVDNSKKEIGSLLKLNSLQKRLKSIEHIIGGWKPSKKNPSVTAQIEYTQRKLDLLDAVKMQVFKKRATQLIMDLEDMQNEIDLKKRAEEIGHDKAKID